MRHEARATALVAPMLLVGAALALRLPTLATRSLWLDEAWRANLVLTPAWDAFWRELLGGALPGSIGAPMPPLFALAVRGLSGMLGPSEAALRLVPLVASVLAVPLAYLVGRRWLGHAAGVAVAWCLACYAAPVLHGQELKPYAVDVLVVLVLVALAGRVIDAPTRRRPWVVMAPAAALAPGVSYPAALVLPGVALALLGATRATPGAWRRWVAVQTVAGVAAAGWYVLAIAPQRARPQVAAYWAGGFPDADPGSLLGWSAGQLVGVTRYAAGEPVWAFVALACLGVVLLPRWLGALILVTIGTVGTAAAVGLYPLSPGRTSLFLLPLWYLALAAVVGAVARSRGAGAVARGVALVTLGAVLVWPARASLAVRPVVEETAPLVRWLVAERRPDDHVYVYYGAVPAFRFYHPDLDARVHLGASHRGDPEAYTREVRALLEPGRRLWLLFAHVLPAERSVIVQEASVYGRELAARETVGASMHLLAIERAPGSVRHLRLRPEDARDPARLRELLRRRP